MKENGTRLYACISSSGKCGKSFPLSQSAASSPQPRMAAKTGGSGDTYTVITCFRCGNQVNQPQGTRRTICPYCGGFFEQEGAEPSARRPPEGKPPARQTRRALQPLPGGRGSRSEVREPQFPRRSSADSTSSAARRQVRHVARGEGWFRLKLLSRAPNSVSYTHLTLPTILLV